MAGERLQHLQERGRHILRTGAAAILIPGVPGAGLALIGGDSAAARPLPAAVSTPNGVRITEMPTPYVHPTRNDLARQSHRGNTSVYAGNGVSVTEQLRANGTLSVTERTTGTHQQALHATLHRGQEAIFPGPAAAGGMVVATFPQLGQGQRAVWVNKPGPRRPA